MEKITKDSLSSIQVTYNFILVEIFLIQNGVDPVTKSTEVIYRLF